MTNTNPSIQDLKKQLIDATEQTDDLGTIVRCLSLMGITVEFPKTEEETIEPEMEATKPEESEEQPVSEKATQSPKKGIIIAIATLLIIVAGWFLLSKYVNFSGPKESELVTVAENYRTITVGDCSFNMVYVEGGTFTMGATPEQGDDFDGDERPLHQVTLSSYMIGETEVTQQLWTTVMGEGPLPYDGDQHPMKSVSYDDCIIFVKQLNEMTGLHFHLPTEAQWEFAARGGNKTQGYRFSGSDNIDDVGWYANNSWNMGKGHPDFGNHRVGSKQPNELGLYDMSGNVWEWCADYFGRYTDEAKTDPTGPDNPMASYRVNRGGSWDYIATSSRSSNRRNRTPDFRNFNLGLRLALDIQ